jgi:putative ABC transport system substrate-binding protein
MRLIGLAVVLTLSLALAPLPAGAQEAGKVWRVGVLEPSELNSRAHLVAALSRRLRELGYEEGRNVAIELRFANGKLESLPELAAELVRLKVDAIVASTTPSIRAAQKATKTIPIVMSTVGDPIEAGFVASFAHPGGNITGRTTQAPELMGKRVQLFKEAVPNLTNVAVLLDTRNTHEIHGFKQVTAAAQQLGIKLQSVEVRGPEEIEAAFVAKGEKRADGLLVFENAINNTFRKRIVDLAAKYRLPGIYPFRDFTEGGGLMSFGASIIDNYRQAAVYLDKIFRGAKPANLPVEQPTQFELVINLKTAKALGLTIPQTILLQADQVIE